MNNANRWLLNIGSTALLVCIATGGVALAQTFKVGDVVEVDDAGINYWERATIVPLKDGDPQDGSVYRVKRAKFSPLRDPAGEISQTIHIRTATSASAATAGTHAAPSAAASTSSSSPALSSPATSNSATSTSSGLNPRMNGAFPFIPGTGWDLIGMQKKGEAASAPKSFAQSFSFCKSGRWSITRYGLAAGQMGTYTVQGGRLVMTNSLNNELFGNFSMAWRGADKVLVLDDGKWIWTLKLVSLNACGE